MTTKVEYVKAQPQTREHLCHWPGCEKQVPPAMWGCKPHWFALPKPIRDAIWSAYRPGQENTMSPSREYIAAALDAQEWIAARELERAETPRANDKATPDLFD